MEDDNFTGDYLIDLDSKTNDEPDADSIKLFIGQIPKDISKEELKKIFEVYGPIHQLVKVKDRVTQENKGCAFITYYKRQSAIDAQNELHGKKSFPGLKGLMQVKPANSELKNEEERKLFVGMLPKGMTDEELKTEMQTFGAVDDCVILRDRDANSKGCAFVTYATKKSASNAIKGLHHVKTLEGATAPLVVKIAETQKEKELKKKIKEGSLINNVNNNFGSANSLASQGYFGAAPNLGQLASQAPPNNTLNALSSLSQASGYGNTGNIQNLGTALSAIASDPLLSAFLNPNMALIQQLAAGATNAMNQVPANTTFGVYGNSQPQQPSSQVANWKNPGMDDCNLFIFNIPENYREADLMQLFAPFGNIVSSRVYYDKKTNKSKGFGFVSYDNSSSSKAAIQAMNGAHVGNRRIKVELKKPRTDGKPY